MPLPPAESGDIAAALVGVGVLAGLSLVFLMALRAAGLSAGRAVVAGALTGMLLGPTVFGRIAPAAFERVFVGAAEQRRDLEIAQLLSNPATATGENISETSRQGLMERASSEVRPRSQALERARRSHQRPLRWALIFTACVIALLAASRFPGRHDTRQRWVTSASVGAWSFLIPASAAYICAMRWWEATLSEAIALAAIVGTGPWAIGSIERTAADGAESGGARMMVIAGRIAATMSLAMLIYAAVTNSMTESAASLLALLIVSVVGWILSIRVRDSSIDSARNVSRTSDARVQWIIEPLIAMLAAGLALHIDLQSQLGWAMAITIVVVALIADDGRWVGAFLGAMLLGGRPMLRTMRLVMPAMSAGPSQLALAVVGVQGQLVPARWALPLLAAVLVMELTAPARRSMTRRLLEIEDELEEAGRDREV